MYNSIFIYALKAIFHIYFFCFIHKIMSSIKDFSKEKERIRNKTITQEQCEQIIKENPNTFNNLQESLQKYQNLSQSELMSELLKEAGKLKQDGTLNESSLAMLKSTLSPMLSQEQNEQLNNILNKIK